MGDEKDGRLGLHVCISLCAADCRSHVPHRIRNVKYVPKPSTVVHYYIFENRNSAASWRLGGTRGAAFVLTRVRQQRVASAREDPSFVGAGSAEVFEEESVQMVAMNGSTKVSSFSNCTYLLCTHIQSISHEFLHVICTTRDRQVRFLSTWRDRWINPSNLRLLTNTYQMPFPSRKLYIFVRAVK